jgi:diguanylate cyclase (GGDEF)-like protein
MDKCRPVAVAGILNAVSPTESDLQTNPAQNLQDVTMQLHALLEQVKSGVAGDAVARKLQVVLETVDAIATIDGLTGALNRRGLVEELDAELNRAKRTGHPFSFALISIDQFPKLNEQYGSAVSDQVLKSLTAAALSLIRSLDSLGRIGQNEFALILPTTWLDQSEGAIVRLTKAVSALDWAAIAPALTVTFSTGLTTNMTGDTAEAMITRASQALTQAQAKGPGSSAAVEPGMPDFDPALDPDL